MTVNRIRRSAHGHAATGNRSREYVIWTDMKQRCLNTKHPAFQWYGSRGIGVCEQWKGSFIVFLADMGPCPIGWTIERKNTQDGYSPENCTWASQADQQNNKTCNCRMDYLGRNLTAKQWSDETGVSAHLIRQRIRRGLPPEQVLSQQRLARRSQIALRASKGGY